MPHFREALSHATFSVTGEGIEQVVRHALAAQYDNAEARGRALVGQWPQHFVNTA